MKASVNSTVMRGKLATFEFDRRSLQKNFLLWLFSLWCSLVEASCIDTHSLG